MKKLTALVLAAGMAATTASTAFAMSDGETAAMGRAMLTGAIYSSLKTYGVESSDIDKLTLGEVAAINSILNSGDGSDGQKKQQIEAILSRAENR